MSIFKEKDGIIELADSNDCEHGVGDKRDCFVCIDEEAVKKIKDDANKDVETLDGESNGGEKES